MKRGKKYESLGRLIAVLDEQSHLREDVEKTRTDASRTEAQLRGEITRLTADLERANAKGANADAATRKATRLEEECAFLRAEASTASETISFPSGHVPVSVA